MSAQPLTKRQEVALVAIARFTNDNGVPPTVRELAAAIGATSSSTAMQHLRALEKKGYISWQPRQCRTVRIIKTLCDIPRSERA